MRNMKRALSLVLTMVMLLGMVMIPTGAAGNFADAGLIENTEAVAITSGIGLFAGTSDGNFAPKATVTRAQMATIIVKMLRGNDFNADSFKGVGVNPFPDTAAFEGGWAEGYINACYQMGVVAGYGDGTFKPGRELTTAEALTMIINALGIDPGEGDWPTNYMAKAEELKFYGDLAVKPNTNEPLNRDQLAVIVWEGMQYSPKGENGWRIDGYDVLFESYADALKAAGGNAGLVSEAMGEDSLASKVYELKTAAGWITGNAATGEKCTVLSDKDGVVGNYYVQTGLDMLGHYVTVYYKEAYTSDKQPGEVYTIVDESTVVTVSGEAIATAKDYKAAFGSNCAMAGTRGSGVMHFDGTYDCDVNDDNKPDFGTVAGYAAGSAAPMGTYIIVDGVIVTYMAPADVYATYVTDINSAVDHETVTLNDVNSDSPIPNSEDDDRIVEYDGMQIGDYVTYVAVKDSQDNPIYVLSPVEKITGTIAKTRPAQSGSGDYDTITIGDTTYPAFEAEGTSPSKNKTKLETRLSEVDYGQTCALYITEDGSYIGFEEVSGSTVSMENTVFLLGTLSNPIKEKDKYGSVTFVNTARGIDMSGNEVMLAIGQAKDVNGNGVYNKGEDAEVLGSMDAVSIGYYTYDLSDEKEEKAEDIYKLTAYPGGYSSGNPTYTLKPEVNSSGPFPSWGALVTPERVPATAKTGMKFFTVDGSVDDDEPLVVQARSSLLIENSTIASRCYMLVTRVSSGGSEIEAFIYLDKVDTSTWFYFYATADQVREPIGTVEGTGYTVISASTGQEMDIVLAPGSGATLTSAGMYRGTKNQYGLVTAITPMSAASSIKADFKDNTAQVASNVGFLGVSDDFLRGERLTDGADFGLNMVQNGGWLSKVTSAAVVDLRDEAEIEATGAITSLEQMLKMKENDPGLIITFNAYITDNVNSNQGVVKTLFITAVHRRTAGLSAILYADGNPSNPATKIFGVRAVNAELGEEVKVNGYVDKYGDAGAGFYRLGVVNTGELALLPFELNSANYTGDRASLIQGTYGMIAMHNKVNGVVDNGNGTLTLTTANDCTGCGYECTDSMEALAEINVTKDVLVWDNVTKTWTDMDGLLRAINKSDMHIDYYCDSPVYSSSSGGKDTTAELVVITAKDEFTLTCDGEHTGWSAVTGNSITQSGSYYLTADMAETLTISANDVTLCMCGHSIQIPTTSTGSALDVTGTGLKLVTCEPRNVSKLVGVEAPAVNGSYTINTTVDGSRITLTGLYRCSRHGWHDDGTWKPLTGSSMNSGKYYLAGNTTATGKITVSGNVTLCLGSSTLSAPATDVSNFIVVDGSSTTLTIYGDTDGKIQGSSATGTRGIQVKGKATLTLKSGTITGFTNNSSAYGGAGICVDANSTFIMDGGTITGNKVTSANSAALGGAGVTVTNGGKFTMNGGTITGNEVKLTHGAAKGGGGAVSASGGTFTMNGGTIENNTANVASGNWGGGGVHVADTVVSGTTYQGKFIMDGGTIYNNTATKDKSAGGGVSITNGGEFTMNAGTIDGNHAKQGGGVQGYGNTVTVTINGGTISGNKAYNTGNGGGAIAMMEGAPLVINGGEITGNSAYNGTTLKNYGAIFMASASRLEIHGGNIHDNTSATNGVRVSAGGGVIDEAEGTTIIKDTIKFDGTPTITGGTFTTDPSTYVPSTGYTLTQNADSTYTVTKNP